MIGVWVNLISPSIWEHKDKGGWNGTTGTHPEDRSGHRGDPHYKSPFHEIGDMPLVCQNKLLRVLENREFQRVGSPVVHKADVRIVAATNRDLRDLSLANC
jgi:transcriptional regulator of acetoin/glycerol metabolism